MTDKASHTNKTHAGTHERTNILAIVDRCRPRLSDLLDEKKTQIVFCSLRACLGVHQKDIACCLSVYCPVGNPHFLWSQSGFSIDVISHMYGEIQSCGLPRLQKVLKKYFCYPPAHKCCERVIPGADEWYF